MIRNLVDLIYPTPEVAFLDHFERKQFLQIQGNPEKLAALLSLDEINRLLNAGALKPSDVRLYRSGKAIPEFMYHSKETSLSAEAVQGILRKGASMVLDNIGPLVPALAQLERAIERRLQAVTSINAYLGLNKGSAFAAHYDNHEVLIVQVLGQKNWELLGEPEPSSVSVKPCHPPLSCNKAVTWQHTLREGELLYVPRGTWHRATLDEGGLSLHLTITIVRSNGIDYVKRLLEQLKADDFVAADLPNADERIALREYETKLHARITSIMTDFGLERFHSAIDGDRQADPGFHLGCNWQLTADDVLISNLRRPLAALRYQPEASSDIHLNGQSHRFSPLTFAALHEIDGVAEGLQQNELVRRLVDRWTSDEILDAVRKLASMSLITIAPRQVCD